MSSSAARPSTAAAPIRRRRDVAGVPEPPGPFSWSVAYRELVFLSGIRGIDPATGRPDEDDESRIRRIFAHLAALLGANGSSPRHVLSTRVYVTDMARHRPLVNAAFTRFFGAELPARTIVEVRALNQEDTIELEAVAARPRRPATRSRTRSSRAMRQPGRGGAGS